MASSARAAACPAAGWRLAPGFLHTFTDVICNKAVRPALSENRPQWQPGGGEGCCLSEALLGRGGTLPSKAGGTLDMPRLGVALVLAA